MMQRWGRTPLFSEGVAATVVLMVVLNATLLPYIWGTWTLQDSTEITSLYNVGSRPVTRPEYFGRTVDPYAGAQQAEPDYALEHDIVVREKTAPIWNPYQAFGLPLAAGLIAQPYSPFSWIAVIWNTARGHDLFVMVRLFAAGIFAYATERKRFLTKWRWSYRRWSAWLTQSAMTKCCA